MLEARERDAHRIEAFSDVVIGLSLAQVGLSLVVPQHVDDLVKNPGWFAAFLWTFSLVCVLWWNHHRLFRSVFVPTRAAIFLNFVLLGSIVLLAYLAEVINRPTSLHDAAVGMRLYYVALATNFIVWAVLAWVCSRDSAHAGDPEKVRAAERAAIVNASAGVVMLLLDALGAWAFGDVFSIFAVSAAIPLSFVAGGGVARSLGYPRVRAL